MCVNTLLLSCLEYGLSNQFKPAVSQIDKTYGKLEPRHVLGRDSSMKKQRAKDMMWSPRQLFHHLQFNFTMTIRSCLIPTGRKGGLGGWETGGPMKLPWVLMWTRNFLNLNWNVKNYASRKGVISAYVSSSITCERQNTPFFLIFLFVSSSKIPISSSTKTWVVSDVSTVGDCGKKSEKVSGSVVKGHNVT